MKANLEQAIKFVSEQANRVEQARLKYLLAKEPPSNEIKAALFAGQRPDGGWAPFWSADYSSLDATCFRLAQAEQLGLTAEEVAITQAITFLARRAQPDGSWQEDDSVANLAPTWVMPGDKAATLYLTANCGFWLGYFSGVTIATKLAADYLQAQLRADGSLPSFLHANWLAGGLWYKVGQSETAERIFSYLEKRIDQDFSADNLGWLINCLYAAGVPSSYLLVKKATDKLEQQQNKNGSWNSDDNPGYEVHTTLEAIRALRFSKLF